MKTGIIIRVTDLECCRYFYREELGLGEPLYDSPFFTTFRLSPGVGLILRSCSFPYLEHASAATAWAWEPPDYNAVVERMKRLEAMLGQEENFCGQLSCIVRDPEGNCFRLLGPEVK